VSSQRVDLCYRGCFTPLGKRKRKEKERGGGRGRGGGGIIREGGFSTAVVGKEGRKGEREKKKKEDGQGGGSDHFIFLFVVITC